MKTLMALFAAVMLAAGAAPKQLFNGRDLDGWTMTGPGRFVVEDALLKTEGGMGLLFYNKEKIGQATLKVVFKTTGPRDNSGVIIRLPEPPTDPWYGVHNGYEVQIDAGGDEWHCTGAIYSISKVSERAMQPGGEWNTLEIELRGKTTRIRLNGKEINAYKEGQDVPPRKLWYEPVRGPRPDAGYIGLQNHDRNSTVYFKEVSVQPLP